MKLKNKGKPFVKGVSILDSDPTAYKYVKKKYKMRQQGGVLEGLANTALGIYAAYQQKKAADQFIKSNNAKAKTEEQENRNNAYNEALQDQSDRSSIVNMNNAWRIANNGNYFNKYSQLNSDLEQEVNQNLQSSVANGVQEIFPQILSFFKKPKPQHYEVPDYASQLASQKYI